MLALAQSWHTPFEQLKRELKAKFFRILLWSRSIFPLTLRNVVSRRFRTPKHT